MFLYMTAGKSATLDLDRIGLTHLKDARLTKRDWRFDPEKTDGDYCLFGSGDGNVRLDAEKQVWRKAGDVWVGYWVDKKPTAESLQRPVQLSGKKIVLGGQEWLVPTALKFDEADGQIATRTELNRYVTFNDDGELKFGEIEDQFAPLFDMALEFFTATDIPYVRVWEISARTLSYNYFVGKHELCMLNALTKDNAMAINDVLCDADGFAEVQKKIREQGSTTSDGGEVGRDSTSQASPAS